MPLKVQADGKSNTALLQAEEGNALKAIAASGGLSFAFLDVHIGVNRAFLNEQEAN